MSYNFLKANIDNVESNLDLGANKSTNLKFSYELNPEDNTEGLFISGQA